VRSTGDQGFGGSDDLRAFRSGGSSVVFRDVGRGYGSGLLSGWTDEDGREVNWPRLVWDGHVCPFYNGTLPKWNELDDLSRANLEAAWIADDEGGGRFGPGLMDVITEVIEIPPRGI